MDNLLSVEEVKRYLDVEQPGLDHLIERGKLHAYKIGGAYLRFRKEEVLTLKHEFQSGKKRSLTVPWVVKVRDFWRFNNFYILSLIFIAFLFYIVVRS